MTHTVRASLFRQARRSCRPHAWCAFVLAAATAVFLSGCASLGSDGAASVGAQSVIVGATDDVNPDDSGRPSPIVLRVFELNSKAAFDNAQFYNLMRDARESLGSDLVARQELELVPGQTMNVALENQSNTRFIGVIASYRDIDEATWRDTIAVAPGQPNRFLITLGARGVSIARIYSSERAFRTQRSGE